MKGASDGGGRERESGRGVGWGMEGVIVSAAL